MSKVTDSVVLHEWSDGEKMTFAWTLRKPLWRRTHMDTGLCRWWQLVWKDSQGRSQGMAQSHFGWSTFRVPWKMRLKMYFRAVLWRVIGQTKMKYHLSVSFLKKGSEKGMAFRVIKSYVRIFFLSFSIYGVLSNYCFTASSSLKLG